MSIGGVRRSDQRSACSGKLMRTLTIGQMSCRRRKGLLSNTRVKKPCELGSASSCYCHNLCTCQHQLETEPLRRAALHVLTACTDQGSFPPRSLAVVSGTPGKPTLMPSRWSPWPLQNRVFLHGFCPSHLVVCPLIVNSATFLPLHPTERFVRAWA